MSPADAQLFVDLATGLERDLAPLSQEERAQRISYNIRVSHVVYAVWREGDAYRLRRLKLLGGPIGEIEVLAGIPVSGEAHADLLMAACSHGAPMEFLQ
jgi:hypothetical protein